MWSGIGFNRVIKMSLSDTQLRAINGNPYLEKPELADRDGLSVRITPAGTITWQYRFRIDNPSGA